MVLRSLWNGAAGMNAQTLKMDSISNNLANVSTPGYKKAQANFQDLVYQAINQIGNPAKFQSEGNPLQTGVGVKLVSNNKYFSQGSLEETNRWLDLAIEGKGFLGVRLDDGELAYTRNGVLHVDSEGYLANNSGRLETEPQQVKVPDRFDDIIINNDGDILVVKDGQSEVIGRIKLFNFVNTSGLKAIGHNLFKETAGSGGVIEKVLGQTGFGVFRQGFLEMSNVNIADEMVQLIQTQRAYEINSRTIKTSEEMWSMANNLKR